jgi:heme A synthase
MKLDADRARLPERLEAGGAIALLVFLFFLHWYGGSITGLLSDSHISGGTIEATGWEAFTSSRWIWLGTIVFALGGALAWAVGYRLEGPVRIGAVVLGLGVLSSVLIVYRIAYHPGASASGRGIHIAYGIKFGIWLGLLAALAITLGGYVQLRAEAGQPLLSQPERKPRPTAAPEPPSDQPEQAFSGLTVQQPEPGRASPPSDRAG